MFKIGFSIGKVFKKLTDAVGLTDSSGDALLKKAEKERQIAMDKQKKDAELQQQKEEIEKKKKLNAIALETQRMSSAGSGGGNIFQIGKGTGGQLR